MFPTGKPKVRASAPVEEVNAALPVPLCEAPLLTATLLVLIETELTRPVVTVSSSPSSSNAKSLSARAAASSENSGVVKSVTVLETFKVLSNSYCISWVM